MFDPFAALQGVFPFLAQQNPEAAASLLASTSPAPEPVGVPQGQMLGDLINPKNTPFQLGNQPTTPGQFTQNMPKPAPTFQSALPGLTPPTPQPGIQDKLSQGLNNLKNVQAVAGQGQAQQPGAPSPVYPPQGRGLGTVQSGGNTAAALSGSLMRPGQAAGLPTLAQLMLARR